MPAAVKGHEAEWRKAKDITLGRLGKHDLDPDSDAANDAIDKAGMWDFTMDRFRQLKSGAIAEGGLDFVVKDIDRRKKKAAKDKARDAAMKPKIKAAKAKWDAATAKYWKLAKEQPNLAITNPALYKRMNARLGLNYEATMSKFDKIVDAVASGKSVRRAIKEFNTAPGTMGDRAASEGGGSAVLKDRFGSDFPVESGDYVYITTDTQKPKLALLVNAGASTSEVWTLDDGGKLSKASMSNDQLLYADRTQFLHGEYSQEFFALQQAVAGAVNERSIKRQKEAVQRRWRRVHETLSPLSDYGIGEEDDEFDLNPQVEPSDEPKEKTMRRRRTEADLDALLGEEDDFNFDALDTEEDADFDSMDQYEDDDEPDFDSFGADEDFEGMDEDDDEDDAVEESDDDDEDDAVDEAEDDDEEDGDEKPNPFAKKERYRARAGRRVREGDADIPAPTFEDPDWAITGDDDVDHPAEYDSALQQGQAADMGTFGESKYPNASRMISKFLMREGEAMTGDVIVDPTSKPYRAVTPGDETHDPTSDPTNPQDAGDAIVDPYEDQGDLPNPSEPYGDTRMNTANEAEDGEDDEEDDDDVEERRFQRTLNKIMKEGEEDGEDDEEDDKKEERRRRRAEAEGDDEEGDEACDEAEDGDDEEDDKKEERYARRRTESDDADADDEDGDVDEAEDDDEEPDGSKQAKDVAERVRARLEAEAEDGEDDDSVEEAEDDDEEGDDTVEEADDDGGDHSKAATAFVKNAGHDIDSDKGKKMAKAFDKNKKEGRRFSRGSL